MYKKFLSRFRYFCLCKFEKLHRDNYSINRQRNCVISTKERLVERNRLTEFFSEPLIFCEYLSRERARAVVPSDFANPLAKQAARIWQVPFAIEIPLPLETSDLNPSGICAADCRLIRIGPPSSPRSGTPAGPRPPSSPFSPSRISLLLFHYSSFLPRSRRPAGRCGTVSWTVSGGERYPVKIRKANSGRQIRVSFGSPLGITEGFKRLATYSTAAPFRSEFEAQYARPQIFSKIPVGNFVRARRIHLLTCEGIIFLAN